MKNKFLFIILLAGFLVSCGDDEGPEIPEEAVVLSYDGENLTAPTLPAGLYEFAVRFPTTLTRNVVDRSITQVSFYLYNAPAQMYLKISRDVSPTEPGAIENTQMINNPTPNSWNTITLDTPYLMDGSAVWVGIEVTQDDQIQTVGCDAGPANANGDWLYDEATMTWETFINRTNQSESVNWNIKAIIN